MSSLAWLRRLAVSFGIGVTSYVIMLGIMVVSIVYDREAEPVITFAFDTGREHRLGASTGWSRAAIGARWR